MISIIYQFILFIFFPTLILSNEITRLTYLSRQNVDPNSITVSGISSGAAMATQFHFAHSKNISGVGIFAGIPYMCGKRGTFFARSICMENPELTDLEELYQEVYDYSGVGSIDPTSYLLGDKVYVYHGKNDSVVKPKSGENISQMYSHFGGQIFSVFSYPAEHGMVTDDYGSPCSSKSGETQYLNNCNYNGAFDMLNYLYGGDLKNPETENLKGTFNEFDQSEFFPGSTPYESSMDNSGFVYIPRNCKNNETICKLHFAFHGCSQCRSQQNVGAIYATKSGYLEVAEANDIVVVFPQATINNEVENPACCWNWFGYLSDRTSFGTKYGAQITTINSMMNRLVNG